MVKRVSEPSNCCHTKYLSRKLKAEGQRVLEQVYNPDLIHASNEEQSAYTLKAILHYLDLCRHNLHKQTKTQNSNRTSGTLARKALIRSKRACSWCVYEYICKITAFK